MDLTDFEEKSVERYVRNGIIITEAFVEKNGRSIVDDSKKEFHVLENWPIIEEVRAFAYKSDPRIALLVRNFFDYIEYLEERGEYAYEQYFKASPAEVAKPQKFGHVNYESDISGLQIPFSPEDRHILLYSEAVDGSKLFTVNLGIQYAGIIEMTADEEEIGKVLMSHSNDVLPKLLETHRGRIEGYELLRNHGMFKKANETLDNIFEFSHQYSWHDHCI